MSEWCSVKNFFFLRSFRESANFDSCAFGFVFCHCVSVFEENARMHIKNSHTRSHSHRMIVRGRDAYSHTHHAPRSVYHRRHFAHTRTSTRTYTHASTPAYFPRDLRLVCVCLQVTSDLGLSGAQRALAVAALALLLVAVFSFLLIAITAFHTSGGFEAVVQSGSVAAASAVSSFSVKKPKGEELKEACRFFSSFFPFQSLY